MDIEEGKALGAELSGIEEKFDRLAGKEKLEFLKMVLEKMENGEVEVDGVEVLPRDIGIEDVYGCCYTILELIKIK